MVASHLLLNPMGQLPVFGLQLTDQLVHGTVQCEKPQTMIYTLPCSALWLCYPVELPLSTMTWQKTILRPNRTVSYVTWGKKVKIPVATGIPKACFTIAILVWALPPLQYGFGCVWHLLCISANCWVVGTQAQREANIMLVSVLLDWSLHLPLLQAKHPLACHSLRSAESKSRWLQEGWHANLKESPVRYWPTYWCSSAVSWNAKQQNLQWSTQLLVGPEQLEGYFCKCTMILFLRRAVLEPGKTRAGASWPSCTAALPV